MGQFPDLTKVEESGTAFDRMRGAKDAIDQLFIDCRPLLFDGKKIGFNGGEVFPAFREVFLYEFVIHVEIAHGPCSSYCPLTLKC